MDLITDQHVDYFVDHQGQHTSLFVVCVILLTVAMYIVGLIAIVMAVVGWFSFIETYYCSLLFYYFG
jgi:hypothetical protein